MRGVKGAACVRCGHGRVRAGRGVSRPSKSSNCSAGSTAKIEIGHNNPIGFALSDRDLVNTNDSGPGLTSALDLLAHVLHLERLDGSPIEKMFLRHILDRG